MNTSMRKDWLWKQMQEVRKDVNSWPQWMKDAVSAPRQQESEPSYPNHYDKDGYCDNPARGY